MPFKKGEQPTFSINKCQHRLPPLPSATHADEHNTNDTALSEQSALQDTIDTTQGNTTRLERADSASVTLHDIQDTIDSDVSDVMCSDVMRNDKLTLSHTVQHRTSSSQHSTSSSQHSTGERVCKCNALVGQLYCKWHIKEHPEAYQAWLSTREVKKRADTALNPYRYAPVRQKYAFADGDLRERYLSQMAKGGKLLDLREDIALMVGLLERVINEGKFKTGEVLRLIDMQRKCISTMNDLRKTTADIMTQDRTETLLNKIVNIINEKVADEDTKRQIAIEFIKVAQDYKDA